MPMRTPRKTLPVAFSAVCLATTALAFDPSGEPNYGRHTLSADGSREFSVALRAGGHYDSGALDTVSSYCIGYIADTPDVVLTVPGNAQADTLYLSTYAASDTTLTVMDPAGNLHCNDDAEGRGLNAGLALPANAGEYKVWVGIHYPDDFPEAVLRAAYSSPILGPKPGVRFALDWEQVPTFEHLTLAAGFGPTPLEFDMIAGGSDVVPSSLGFDCYGYVYGAAPDYTLSYSGQGSLHFSAWADADLTLIVRAPNDVWHCNDDYEGLNPGLSINNALTGTYAIWVGTYGMDEPDATLQISEVRPFQESSRGSTRRKGN